MHHDGQVPQYRVIFEKKRRGELRDDEGNRLNNPTDIPISEQPVIMWVDDGTTRAARQITGVWLENRHGFGYVHIGKVGPDNTGPPNSQLSSHGVNSDSGQA